MENCKNIRVKNLSIDFAEPFHSESIITSHNSDGSFDMSISKEYPYEIRNGQLVLLNHITNILWGRVYYMTRQERLLLIKQRYIHL